MYFYILKYLLGPGFGRGRFCIGAHKCMETHCVNAPPLATHTPVRSLEDCVNALERSYIYAPRVVATTGNSMRTHSPVSAPRADVNAPPLREGTTTHPPVRSLGDGGRPVLLPAGVSRPPGVCETKRFRRSQKLAFAEARESAFSVCSIAGEGLRRRQRFSKRRRHASGAVNAAEPPSFRRFFWPNWS